MIQGPLYKERLLKHFFLLTIDRVVPRHTEYTRFVILTTARTGSTLLLTLLNTHKQTRMYGEIIKVLSNKYSKDLAGYIDSSIFGPRAFYVEAVGFKIFYKHGNLTNIWEYLKNNPTIRIIHLKRKNKLKQLFSTTKAHQTNLYSSAKGKLNSYNQPILISPEDCLSFFEEQEKIEQQMDLNFQKHSVFTLYYESLVKNINQEMSQVLAFLDLPDQKLSTPLKKQSNKSIIDLIENYEQLKKRFQGTKWEDLFE